MWVKLDDAMLDNSKIAAVGPIGFALHVAGILYCGRNLTDGFVPWGVARKLLLTSWAKSRIEPDHQVEVRRLAIVSGMTGMNGDELIEETIEELCLVNLWEQVPDGYLIHDYLTYNPSRAQVLLDRAEKREKKAEAGRRGGLKKAANQKISSRLAAASCQLAAELVPGVVEEAAEKVPQVKPRAAKPRSNIKASSELADGWHAAGSGPSKSLADGWQKASPVPVNKERLSIEGTIPLAESDGLAKLVTSLWCSHRGWPAYWPPEKEPKGWRHDSATIVKFVRAHPYPIQFWKDFIPTVPRDVAFSWVTTPPAAGIVGLAEERYGQWQQAQWAREKQEGGAASERFMEQLQRRMSGEQAASS